MHIQRAAVLAAAGLCDALHHMQMCHMVCVDCTVSLCTVSHALVFHKEMNGQTSGSMKRADSQKQERPPPPPPPYGDVWTVTCVVLATLPATTGSTCRPQERKSRAEDSTHIFETKKNRLDPPSAAAP